MKDFESSRGLPERRIEDYLYDHRALSIIAKTNPEAFAGNFTITDQQLAEVKVRWNGHDGVMVRVNEINEQQNYNSPRLRPLPAECINQNPEPLPNKLEPLFFDNSAV